MTYTKSVLEWTPFGVILFLFELIFLFWLYLCLPCWGILQQQHAIITGALCSINMNWSGSQVWLPGLVPRSGSRSGSQVWLSLTDINVSVYWSGFQVWPSPTDPTDRSWLWPLWTGRSPSGYPRMPRRRAPSQGVTTWWWAARRRKRSLPSSRPRPSESPPTRDHTFWLAMTHAKWLVILLAVVVFRHRENLNESSPLYISKIYLLSSLKVIYGILSFTSFTIFCLLKVSVSCLKVVNIVLCQVSKLFSALCLVSEWFKVFCI